MIREEFSCIRGQNTIRGLVYRPTGSNLPAIILSHGFMANYKTVEGYAKSLSNEGYACFIFDYCGGGIGGKSDGKTTEMSTLTEVEDLKSVIEFVSGRDYVNKKDIGLLGCSHGGFVSSLVAAELGERISRLILFYPAYCMPDDARKGQMQWAKIDPNNVPETFWCFPMKLGRRYATDIMDMDPYEIIGGYKGPVLILHGTADKVVKQHYIEKAYRIYLENNGGRPTSKCQLVLIDGANHGFRGMKMRMWDDLAIFAIKQFLKGRAAVLQIDVKLAEKQTEKIVGGGKKVRAFFTAHAESEYFEGSAEPGSYDEQIWKGIQPDECCADYILKGKDCSGEDCEVRIINKMPPGGKKDWAKGWIPTVSTNSNTLSFLNDQQCEAYLVMRKQGPLVRIFADPLMSLHKE